MQIAGARIKVEKPIEKSHNDNPFNASNGNYPNMMQQNLNRPPNFDPRRPPPNFAPAPPPPFNAWDYRSHYPGLPEPKKFPWMNQNQNKTGNPQLTNTNYQNQNNAFKTELDMNFYVDASTKICLELSKGIEKPTEFVSVLNEIYSKKGLPTIDIPNHFLDSSRNKFLQDKKNLIKETIATPNPFSASSSMPTSPELTQLISSSSAPLPPSTPIPQPEHCRINNTTTTSMSVSTPPNMSPHASSSHILTPALSLSSATPSPSPSTQFLHVQNSPVHNMFQNSIQHSIPNPIALYYPNSSASLTNREFTDANSYMISKYKPDSSNMTITKMPPITNLITSQSPDFS